MASLLGIPVARDDHADLHLQRRDPGRACRRSWSRRSCSSRSGIGSAGGAEGVRGQRSSAASASVTGRHRRRPGRSASSETLRRRLYLGALQRCLRLPDAAAVPAGSAAGAVRRKALRRRRDGRAILGEPSPRPSPNPAGALPARRAWRRSPPSALWPRRSLAPEQGYLLNIFMQAATYASRSIGLVVVLGYCGQISIAQAGFFGIGAYGVALGTVDAAPAFPGGLARRWAVFAGLPGGCCSWARQSAAGRPLPRHGDDQLSADPDRGADQLDRPQPTARRRLATSRGPHCSASQLQESGATLSRDCAWSRWSMATAFLVWRLKTSQARLGMQAVRDNELAAGTCGVDTFRIKVTVVVRHQRGAGRPWAAGCSPAAFGYISPDQFSFNESIVLLTMALLGGVQSPFGALLGTCALVILPEWLRFLRQCLSGGLRRRGHSDHGLPAERPMGLWPTSRRRVPPLRIENVPPLPLLVDDRHRVRRGDAADRGAGQAFRRAEGARRRRSRGTSAAPSMR